MRLHLAGVFVVAAGRCRKQTNAHWLGGDLGPEAGRSARGIGYHTGLRPDRSCLADTGPARPHRRIGRPASSGPTPPDPDGPGFRLHVITGRAARYCFACCDPDTVRLPFLGPFPQGGRERREHRTFGLSGKTDKAGELPPYPDLPTASASSLAYGSLPFVAFGSAGSISRLASARRRAAFSRPSERQLAFVITFDQENLAPFREIAASATFRE